jgi:tRNA(Ile)-lysidine synthase
MAFSQAMDRFYQQVCMFIHDNQLLLPGSRVLAAVSGGADSLALLVLLARLRDSLPCLLAAAHLNHGLRGASSDEDEAFVRDWCSRLDIHFFSRKIDLAELAERQGRGLEETGRQSRLAFFNDLAEQFESEGFPGESAADAVAASSIKPPVRIALAHHLDDQAETLLLHLGRGCGLDGLVGMKPLNGRLIRPFLAKPRCEIEQWLSGQQISWRLDGTNADLFALRNRLRHQVLPAWKLALGYDPAPLLYRTALSLSEDQNLLDQLAQIEAGSCLAPGGLARCQWQKLAPSLQNRILRIFWRQVTGSGRDLAQSHILALRDFLPGAAPGQRLCLPGGWLARLEGDERLKLIKQEDPPSDQDANTTAVVLLKLPGVTKITVWNVEVEALFVENNSQIVYNSAMEYFWLDRINGCVVRHRIPGDRIRPIGRLGEKTLKKYLNELKVPPQRRAELLMIASGRDIVWLPGYTAGFDFVGRPGDGRPGQLVRLEWRGLVPDVTAAVADIRYDLS